MQIIDSTKNLLLKENSLMVEERKKANLERETEREENTRKHERLHAERQLPPDEIREILNKRRDERNAKYVEEQKLEREQKQEKIQQVKEACETIDLKIIPFLDSVNQEGRNIYDFNRFQENLQTINRVRCNLLLKKFIQFTDKLKKYSEEVGCSETYYSNLLPTTDKPSHYSELVDFLFEISRQIDNYTIRLNEMPKKRLTDNTKKPIVYRDFKDY